MAKSSKEIIAIMEKDRATFQAFIDDVKKHKVKMLNPKKVNEVIGSASIVAYLNTRLQEFKE